MKKLCGNNYVAANCGAGAGAGPADTILPGIAPCILKTFPSLVLGFDRNVIHPIVQL
jgi:hypothetical protein